MNEKLGRVMDLEFKKNDRVTHLQVSLIPHAANAIATHDDKKISFYRPSEIAEKKNETIFAAANELATVDFDRIERDYLQKLSAGDVPKKISSENSWEKKREKKITALQKLGEIEFDKRIAGYLRLGERLKISDEILPEDLPFYDQIKSRSENMKTCFEKAKKLKEKKVGHEARKASLTKEIAELEAAAERGDNSIQIGTVKTMKNTVKVRTLQLKEGRIARFGKSATDNLNLLREARAWDIWVHLKDEPSSHGIIFCEKARPPSDDEIREVGRWIFFEKRKSKIVVEGLRVSLIVCECRYVRPIRGDRHGRVTHTNAKTFEFRL